LWYTDGYLKILV